MMAIQEIITLLEGLRTAYNTGNHSSYVNFFSNPLAVVEDRGNYSVTDTVILNRLFDSWMHCQEYLDLSTVSFHLKHLQMTCEHIGMVTIVWEFFNTDKNSEVILEASYLVQNKPEGWKIVTIIQPAWRYPILKREDIKKLSLYKNDT